MVSEFEIHEWITSTLQRQMFSELRPILRAVKSKLGPSATLETREDSALIVTAPFALMLETSGGDTIRAYCGVFDGERLKLRDAMQFEFTQHQQKLARQSWSWFPRVRADGPTSYRRKRLRNGAYEWVVGRVRPVQDSSYHSANRNEFIEAISERIAADYLDLRNQLLSAISPT